MDEMLKYDRVTEPRKAQKAQIWKTAIGLQAVDGLKTSEYLIGFFGYTTATSLLSSTRTSPSLSIVFPLGIIFSSPLWIITRRLPSFFGYSLTL